MHRHPALPQRVRRSVMLPANTSPERAIAASSAAMRRASARWWASSCTTPTLARGVHHLRSFVQYRYNTMRAKEASEVISAWGSTMVPPEAVAFARQVVAAARPSGAERAKALLYAASRAGAFAMAHGTELLPEVVLRPSFVERFTVEGRREVSAPTRRTLRTNLRALARALEPYPEPLPVPLPREHAKKPYTQKEISAFLALADAQPTAARRWRSGAVVCLGAGAGLVGADLSGVRGGDVCCRSGGVVVEVRGRHARGVPLLARYHHRLLEAAASAGEGFVLGGTERSRRNVAAGLVASLTGGGDLPRLELARLRATWLAEVASAIGLQVRIPVIADTRSG